MRDFTLNEEFVVATQRLFLEADVNVDVVCFQSEQFRDELTERLDAAGAMLHAVHALTPEDLLYCLPRWPGLRCIHDPDPNRLFTWGSWGRHTPPEQVHLIGRL